MRSNINGGIFNNKSINNEDIDDIIAAFEYEKLQIADGTAEAPSIHFLEDADIGLYRIGKDSIGIYTGGGLCAGVKTSDTTITSPLFITNATYSDDILTGAVVVDGGLAVAKNVNIGGDATSSIFHLSQIGELANGQDEKLKFSTDTILVQIDGFDIITFNTVIEHNIAHTSEIDSFSRTEFTESGGNTLNCGLAQPIRNSPNGLTQSVRSTGAVGPSAMVIVVHWS